MNELDIKNPWKNFAKWWEETKNIGLQNPNAVSLATSGQNGKPNIRTVLLKEFSQKEGFIFYTNLNSRKGKALQENPNIALLFYWDALEKQIEVVGSCRILSAQKTTHYFHTRPRQSQIGAWASQQSQVLKNRKELIKKYKKFEKIYQNKEIPLPEYWRGVALQPVEMEFWQSGDCRLHQRIRFYFKDNYNWNSQILSP